MKNSEWLYKCLETAEFLYGIFPFEVLNRMYRLKAPDDLKYDEVSYFLEETVSNYVLEDDEIASFRKLGYGTKILRPTLYSEDTVRLLKSIADKHTEPGDAIHMDERAQTALLARQGDRPFFIPSVEQIEFFLEEGYFPSAELKNVYKIFKNSLEIEDVFEIFFYESEYQDVLNILMANADLRDPDDFSEVSKYINTIMNAYNFIKRRDLRGYSPNELGKLAHGSDNGEVVQRLQREFEAMGVKPKETVQKKTKVGRNDPCPCGSGKKYKHCCLRKTMA